MPTRSQRHMREIQSKDAAGLAESPLITNIAPNTATLANVGATGRTVATLTATGGASPYTFGLNGLAGCNITINPTTGVITTTVNPVHASTGVKTLSVSAVDQKGQVKIEDLALTLT